MVYTILIALTEKLNKDNEDRKTFEADEKERLERQREEEELVNLSLLIIENLILVYNYSFF